MRIKLLAYCDGEEITVTTKRFDLHRDDDEIISYLQDEVAYGHEGDLGEVSIEPDEEDDDGLVWEFEDAEFEDTKEAKKALRQVKTEIEVLLSEVA